MARTNNLTNFLNDVATAIKTKLGDNTPIPASQFDTKIGEIETAGTYQAKSVTIQSNSSQTITPDSEYDALSSVIINVQVPVKQLQSKSYEFTQNTHIVLSPETGYDGFSSIELTINVPSSGDTSDATATAQEILNGKTAYISTGKVTGSMEAARHFHNKQAMITYETNNNCNMGDLAIIYDLVQTNWSGTGTLGVVTFPQQVVLPEAFTGDAYMYGQTEEYWDIDGSISSTNMSLTIYGEDSYRITYTSEDGITYNRTDSYSNSIDFGGQTTNMHEYDDVFGNFFKIIGGSFGGLYEYNTSTEYNACFLFNNMDMVYDDINWWIVKLPYLKYAFNDDGNGSGFYKELIITRYTTRLYQGVTIVEPTEYYGYNTTMMNPGIRIDKTTHKLCTYGDSKAYLDKYVNGEYVETISYENGEPTMTDLDLLNTIIVSHKSPFTNENSMAFVDFPSTTSSTRTLYFSLENVPTVNEFISAKTQFTLSEANELLPKLVALGKNGEVTGSDAIYDNIPAEEMFKRVVNMPLVLEDTDGDKFRLYSPTNKIITMSSHRSDTPAYLVRTSKTDQDINYIVGIAEYMYGLPELSALYGTTAIEAYIHACGNYIVCIAKFIDNTHHILVINNTFTSILNDVLCPADTTSFSANANYYSILFNCNNGSTSTCYIFTINGEIVPLNITPNGIRWTDDGYMLFKNTATNKIQLFNPTDNTIYDITSNITNLIYFGLYNFSDKAYICLIYRTGTYGSYTYTRTLYLYNKSTKTSSSVVSGTTSKDIYIGDTLARQTCIILNNVLYDYGRNYFCRLTNTGSNTYLASNVTMYINNSTDKMVLNGCVTNNIVRVRDYSTYKDVNYSTISNVTSITDIHLDETYARYCVIHCNLTPVMYGLGTVGYSALVFKRWDSDEQKYYTDMCESGYSYNDGTIDVSYVATYDMLAKFKLYCFKLANNNEPEFMLMKTGFIKQNHSSVPSTMLIPLNISKYLEEVTNGTVNEPDYTRLIANARDSLWAYLNQQSLIGAEENLEDYYEQDPTVFNDEIVRFYLTSGMGTWNVDTEGNCTSVEPELEPPVEDGPGDGKLD